MALDKPIRPVCFGRRLQQRLPLGRDHPRQRHVVLQQLCRERAIVKQLEPGPGLGRIPVRDTEGHALGNLRATPSTSELLSLLLDGSPRTALVQDFGGHFRGDLRQPGIDGIVRRFRDTLRRLQPAIHCRQRGSVVRGVHCGLVHIRHWREELSPLFRAARAHGKNIFLGRCDARLQFRLK